VGVLTACVGFVQVEKHTHTHSWASHVHGHVPMTVRTSSLLTCVLLAAMRVKETLRES